MISGALSLLCSRSFSPFPHGTGSLSVSWLYLALRDGPRWFTPDFSCPALLRCRLGLSGNFTYGAFTLCGGAFQRFPLFPRLPLSTVLQPRSLPRQRRFGLLRVRSPLLAQSLLLSFPPGNEMFQFPGSASRFRGMTGSLPPGCPIRISADLWVFAPPRGFSQLVTSFFASRSPGILHVPFSPFRIMSLNLQKLWFRLPVELTFFGRPIARF